MKKKQFDSKLAKYSTAAGAVFAGATAANAGIIYTEVDETLSNSDVSFNVDLSGGNDLGFGHSQVLYTSGTWTTSSSSSTTFTYGFANVFGLSGAKILQSSTVAQKLAFGGVISASANSWGNNAYLFHTSSNTRTSGEFDGGSSGYIGFRFDPNGGTDWKYGWVHIDSVAEDFSSFHISGYAYEDSGDPITAGAVPEPSSLALLACGAAGALVWRKRLC
jgi:hypothetical protein